MLTSCPSVLKLLFAKNKLSENYDQTEANGLVLNQQNFATNTITFTADFVKYYFGIALLL